ncbi:hypothetical protein KCP70_17835 [Salmonella enterica subsp. enterica]|nr:hypothetical protein KCP70_17835 [Salmonella enterica subsp. enterica]
MKKLTMRECESIESTMLLAIKDTYLRRLTKNKNKAQKSILKKLNKEEIASSIHDSIMTGDFSSANEDFVILNIVHDMTFEAERVII